MDTLRYEALIKRLYEKNKNNCVDCGAVSLGTPYNEIKHKPGCEVAPVLLTKETK